MSGVPTEAPAGAPPPTGVQAPGRLPGARPGSDGLGLRQALSDRLLPALVAAMAFLAALALAGAAGAHALATRWDAGAGTLLTVQVPDPSGPAGSTNTTRLALVRTRLEAVAGPGAVEVLGEAELRRILEPWLGTAGASSGEADALPLPAVLELHLAPGGAPPPDLAARLAEAAPGTLVENDRGWRARLFALTTSLQACAGLVLLVVAGVAASVVALATRAAIAARRHAIEIIHALGATDGYLAGRFARRVARLAAIGGVVGLLLSVPVLGLLSHLAAPFARTRLAPDALPGGGAGGAPGGGPWTLSGGGAGLSAAFALPDHLPAFLLLALPGLVAASAAIGWLTTQFTVRLWLRRLP